jgi:secreted PhoX family phosphatase
MWGAKGSNDGEFNKPEDIAINQQNRDVYITDTKNSRIQHFKMSK